MKKENEMSQQDNYLDERLQTLLRFPIPDRIVKLRPYTISDNVEWVGDINYERISTRVYRETEGDPVVLRRAKLFAAICREYPISIGDESLLSGYQYTTRATRPLMVSTSAGAVATPRAGLTEAELEEFESDLRPYWAGLDGKYRRTRYGQTFSRYTEEMKNVFLADPDSFPQLASCYIDAEYCRIPHVCHTEVQQEKILRIGLRGFIREAEERLMRIDRNDPNSLKQIHFLNGVIIALEGACEVGPRFARLAREMASQETDAKRAEELLKIAEVNDRVPANPAGTFREAVQAAWTIHFLHWWETPVIGGITQGRLDQYLYPFYIRDLEEGRLTQEEALELIDCLMLKLGEAHALTGMKIAGDTQWMGDSVAHHIDIGGIKPEDGTDATNELTYLFLEAILHTRCTIPNVGVLLHRNTPGELLRRALECVSLGLPQPYFFNVDTMMRIAFQRAAELGGAPVTLEQARNMGAVGCAEAMYRGVDCGYVGAGTLGVPHMIEHVLTRGVSPFYKRRMGVDTGDPCGFKTFEEFLAAFEKQLDYAMDLVNQGSNIGDSVTAELEPTLFQSALIGDCIEKAMTREDGGARYNHGAGFGINGSPDAANALYAVKKLVFEDIKLTMETLCRAIAANWEGFGDIRQQCLNVPKYGNDNDEADAMHAYVLQTLYKKAHRYVNRRGGKKGLCQVPMALHLLSGRVLGALPSGRCAGDPVSDGISPVQGTDINGALAVLKSVGKVGTEHVDFGTVLNLRLSPDIFRSESGYRFGVGVLRAFVESGAFHVQFNVVSTETLRAAQREPERHKDLMVRVAGYAAYFCELPAAMQEAIIIRTEHSI